MIQHSSISLSEGHLALKAGDWSRARSCFEAALAHEESPEAHDGLGIALWWANSVEQSHRHRSTAYQGFKQRGEYARAALIATWLGREQVFLHANASAMKGWFARAERLLKQTGPCPEQSWFTLFRASMLAPPEELVQTALRAAQVAQAFGDSNLEALALAFGGLAQVSGGQVEDGMVHLDEAMVAVTGGEVADFMVVSEVFCVMLSACELSGDLVRTEHWCQAAAEFASQRNCPFLGAYCRTTYGGLLLATGRWQAAETELSQAIHLFEHGHRALRVHAALKLADLRVHQGRLEEAEALLADYHDYSAALLPMTRLHIARGEVDLARALLEQSLAPLGPEELHVDSLDAAPKLLLLCDVLIRLGDLQAASSVANRIMQLAGRVGSDLLQAQAELASGQLKWKLGQVGAAAHFHAALEKLKSYEQSLLASRVRLEMARLLEDTDWPGAVTWAKAALACFERMGAKRDADEAAGLLRKLGVATRPGPKTQGDAPGHLTQREREVMALLSKGLTNGQIAQRLFMSVKTTEHHVSQILHKLGVRSRTEAVAQWAQIESSYASEHPEPLQT
jgi:ATP/maltotriose-dependent transcriptional regulator MalT